MNDIQTVIISVLGTMVYLMAGLLCLALSGVDPASINFDTKKDTILTTLKIVFGPLYLVYTLGGFMLYRGPKMFFMWWKNLPDDGYEKKIKDNYSIMDGSVEQYYKKTQQ